jgi:(p)ppGpp synthase/HD superfamily hydrolase
MMYMLNSMLSLAARKHDGQYDKGGKPYILHVLTVMHKLRTEDEELMCIALGHDLIEDTDTTYGELFDAGMTDRVVAGIKAMTKAKGETFEEYKDKVKANPDAVLVKMADLQHNTDIRRLKGIGLKDLARMQKYHQFWMELRFIKGLVG